MAPLFLGGTGGKQEELELLSAVAMRQRAVMESMLTAEGERQAEAMAKAATFREEVAMRTATVSTRNQAPGASLPGLETLTAMSTLPALYQGEVPHPKSTIHSIRRINISITPSSNLPT